MAFALLSALSSLGCFGVPVSPERANVGWVRIETDHFDLSTDLAPADATRAAEALERTRLALLAVAWNRPADGRRITSRTAVVVLRDKAEFQHYSRKVFEGLYQPGPRATILLWGAPEEWERSNSPSGKGKSVLLHELTHSLVAGFYGLQPRWFTEGVAQFLETMRISEDGKSATFGDVNLDAFAGYRAQGRSDVSDALAWSSDAGADTLTRAARYGVSWLLVHFLVNAEPAALAKLQAKLAAGIEPARAWSETFPSTTPAELDERLDQYWRTGTMTKFTRPLPSFAVATVRRPITAADVLTIRASLAFTGAGLSGSKELATEGLHDAQRALALEPGHAAALRLLRMGAQLSDVELLGRLRAQTAQRPDDGEAWLMLSQTLEKGSAEQEAAARRAVSLMPRSAEAYDNLAGILLTTRRGEAALPFAAKAALLAPWSSAALATHAAALFAVGRCPDALSMQQRAIDVSAARVGRRALAELKMQLWEYTNRCGEATPPEPIKTSSPGL